MGISRDRIRKIIAYQLSAKEDTVTDSAKLVEDLHADELDLVEMIMALEEEFGIEIPDEDADKMKTVEDVYNFIEGHSK
jgi:acyl carrier protein